MYVAVSNLGAGGTQDVALSDVSNAVLYGVFALTGLISGGINNSQHVYWFKPRSETHKLTVVLGPKFTLFLGTLGYALYVGALWW